MSTIANWASSRQRRSRWSRARAEYLIQRLDLLARFFVAAFLADFFPAVLAAGFHGFAALCFAVDLLADFFAAFLGAFLVAFLAALCAGALFLAFRADFRWVMA
ncbi:MAG TPA: hypothetical protein VGO54_04380 [Bradyrhizobium sp.]|nr:hypothetical protein [Bradyrhizobium sp.]